MRRQLCDEHVAVENQAAHLEDVMLRRLSKRRLIRLEADIRLLDRRLAEMVATNAAFAQLYELLTSMPGVGTYHSPRPPTATRPGFRAKCRNNCVTSFGSYFFFRGTFLPFAIFPRV